MEVEEGVDTEHDLVGMRPLENGRLALAYRHKVSRKEEVRVFDVRKAFPKTSCYYVGWYDDEIFKSCYLYDGMIFWDADTELRGDHIYFHSKLVKGDFQCIV